MHTLRKIALALVIIGAINWGLIALFQFDLVASIFGGQAAGLSRLVYGLVGLSGLICLSFFFDPETDTDMDRGVQATNQATFGTEFADDFDPEYRRERANENPPRDRDDL
ncbi:DUF378 domain-containing protein [Oceanobacillus sp. HCA-5259]|uniref:DUF378 domain-containing protein n=1 Tax=Oceanobacillus sp. HCA-5259 TaxID=3134661 RepID=UPI0030BFC9D6